MFKPRTISIEGNRIAYNQVPYIIAEAGVNHNGKLAWAYKLIDAAADAKADAVKFQTFKAQQVVIGAGKMAAYQKRNLKRVESQLKMLKRLELPEHFYPKLITYCRKRRITFLSTPHGGVESLRLLAKFHVPALKFGSGDLTNLPLLQAAARYKKPIIIGTGMSTLTEVREAVRAIERVGNKKIIALHCTTNYPCPLDEVNLRAMQTMMRSLHILVGYSDHTLGTDVPFAAACLGACLIEKHLTLSQSLPGPDHKASTEPQEFKALVERLRKIPVLLGSVTKEPNASEVKILPLVRRSLVTLRAMKCGDRFTSPVLGVKRPGTGLPPSQYLKVLGRRARHDIPEDTLLRKTDYV